MVLNNHLRFSLWFHLFSLYSQSLQVSNLGWVQMDASCLGWAPSCVYGPCGLSRYFWICELTGCWLGSRMIEPWASLILYGLPEQERTLSCKTYWGWDLEVAHQVIWFLLVKANCKPNPEPRAGEKTSPPEGRSCQVSLPECGQRELFIEASNTINISYFSLRQYSFFN